MQNMWGVAGFALCVPYGSRKLFFLYRNEIPDSLRLCSRPNNIPQNTMDITMMIGGESSNRQGQVQVHFITNSPDIELPEGKRQLLVPTSEQP